MNEHEESSSADVAAAAWLAQTASRSLPALSGAVRRNALFAVADAIENRLPEILAANAGDVEKAAGRGRPQSAVSRIAVQEARVMRLVRNIRTVAEFADPTGEKVSRWVRPNGLEIERVRVPVGVVGACVEGRPLSFGFIASACVKTANSAVFVVDEDAEATVRALHGAFAAGLGEAGIPPESVMLVEARGSQLAAGRTLVSLDRFVDVAILRGAPSFVRDLAQHASVPVLLHRAGVCHVYVDRDRPDERDGTRMRPNDLARAVKIVSDSRLFEQNRCTSATVALVHAGVAAGFLPLLCAEARKKGLALVADEEAGRFLPDAPRADSAAFSIGPDGTALAVGVVHSMREAIDRINANGAHLCDAIATESAEAAAEFQRDVDSAAVFVNASTNFADGEQFGMGALVGISTGKIGPRGEIGLEGLTSLKYLVRGNGQTRGRQ